MTARLAGGDERDLAVPAMLRMVIRTVAELRAEAERSSARAAS